VKTAAVASGERVGRAGILLRLREGSPAPVGSPPPGGGSGSVSGGTIATGEWPRAQRFLSHRPCAERSRLRPAGGHWRLRAGGGPSDYPSPSGAATRRQCKAALRATSTATRPALVTVDRQSFRTCASLRFVLRTCTAPACQTPTLHVNQTARSQGARVEPMTYDSAEPDGRTERSSAHAGAASKSGLVLPPECRPRPRRPSPAPCLGIDKFSICSIDENDPAGRTARRDRAAARWAARVTVRPPQTAERSVNSSRRGAVQPGFRQKKQKILAQSAMARGAPERSRTVRYGTVLSQGERRRARAVGGHARHAAPRRSRPGRSKKRC
jgi:hypothetical protein